MIRRAAFATASVLALGLSLVGARADSPPIRIGFIVDLSGEFADYGTEILNAAKLYLAQHGGAIAGRKIEIDAKDTGGPNPEVAKRLAQELIVNDKVDLLAGFTLTPEALAVAPLATEAKKPMVIMNAATSIVTEKSPYIVRFSFTLGEIASVLAKWAAENGIKKVYTLVSDYGPGVNAEGAFKKYFTLAGGTIAGSDRSPLKGPEFAPFMQRVKDAKPDALFVFVPSGDQGVAVTKAYQDSGLAGAGIKMIATGDITDEAVIDQLGDAAVGLVTAFHYSDTHPSEANKEYVKAFQAAYGSKLRPDFMSVGGYDGMHGIYDALVRLNGNADPDQALEILRREKFESPRGPFWVDPDTRDAVNTVYIRKVERQGGRLVNTEFKAYPDTKDPDKTK